MTLFLACNDVFRNCTPPEEFFDFGLWFPPEDYARKQLDSKGNTSSAAGYSQASPDSTTDQADQTAQRDVQAAPPPPPPEKVDEEKKEFKELFNDKATASQLADHARSKGFAPSQEDLERLAAKKQDNMSYDDYVAFTKEISHTEDSEDHVVQFFKSYDTAGRGKLSLKQVKNLLMNFGEPLTMQEVEAILKEFNMDSDPVDYNLLAKKLLEA